MKKILLSVAIFSVVFISGCQKEKLSVIPSESQKLSYSSGDEVLTQKSDGILVKFTPKLYKMDENTRYLILGLTVENTSKEEVSINNSMVSVFFKRNGVTQNETMTNVTKEQLEGELAGKRFWMGVLGTMNRPTTYAEYYAKPITDQQKQVQEKQNDDKNLNNLSDILASDTIDPGASIKRIVIPRITPKFMEKFDTIPHAIYTASISFGDKKMEFKFKFDIDESQKVAQSSIQETKKEESYIAY